MKHLAELNIGKFKYPTTDPRMAGFINNLDRVNALAERSKGFVWRLKGDNNNATDIPCRRPTWRSTCRFGKRRPISKTSYAAPSMTSSIATAKSGST